MQPRPLYRWKSFWLGVLVLGFLGWAWWISYKFSTRVSYWHVDVIHCEGYTGIRVSEWVALDYFSHERVEDDAWASRIIPMPFFVRGLERDRGPQTWRGEATYREFHEWAYRSMLPERRALFLPHWLLIATFLVVWTAFLAWRWRRMRRNAEPH